MTDPTRCCDDVAVHCHDGVEHKDGRPYRWRCKFAWRRPKAHIYRTANRPPLATLNRYPGIVIGVAFRVGARRSLSIVWGRPNGIYEVTG